MVFSTSLCFKRNYTPSPVLENFGDIQNTFLDTSDLPEQDHEDVEKLICRITSNDVEFVIKSSQQRRTQCWMTSKLKFTKHSFIKNGLGSVDLKLSSNICRGFTCHLGGVNKIEEARKAHAWRSGRCFQGQLDPEDTDLLSRVICWWSHCYTMTSWRSGVSGGSRIHGASSLPCSLPIFPFSMCTDHQDVYCFTSSHLPSRDRLTWRN